MVDLETPWLIRLFKLSQSIVEAGSDPKAGSEPQALAGADDLVAPFQLAPHVRE
jgi:hypothetical protein